MKNLFNVLFFVPILIFCSSCTAELEDAAVSKPTLSDSAKSAESELLLDNYASSIEQRNLANGRTAATFSNNFYLFYRGNSSETIWKSSSDNGTYWNKESTLGNNAATPLSPTVAYYKGKLLLFYKGVSSTNIWFSYSYDGVNWIGNNKLSTGAQTEEKMCACEFNDKLYLIYSGNKGIDQSMNSLYYSYTSDGINWYGDIKFAEIFDDWEDSGLACATFKNKVHIFHTRYDSRPHFRKGDIYHYYTSDFQSYYTASKSFTGLMASSNTPSALVYQNNLYLFWTGDTDPVRYVYSSNGTNWTETQTIPNARSDRSPDAKIINGLLYVFFKGTDTNKIFYHYMLGNNSWSTGVSTGTGATSASPSATSVRPIDQQNAQENFARFATVSAESTFAGYDAKKIIDGDKNTTVGPSYSWTNNYPTGRLPQSITLDFGRSVSFSRVVLYTSLNYELRDYEILYSNDKINWAGLSVMGNTYTSRTTTFPITNSRYLKIRCLNGPINQSIYARINELEVYNF